MPEWKEHVTKRLASLKLTPTREAEMTEELVQHLEERYQALLAGGATELQARQATLEEIRDSQAFVQELRDVERCARPHALHGPILSLLFGVSAVDPLTFTSVAILLSAVALAACYIPARRAFRVDPVVALRCE